MLLPVLETEGITPEQRYPSSPASCPPSETPRCPAGGDLTGEQLSALRKEEQPQLVLVPPWGWRADSGVPSNTPLSGRTRGYRGRQLLLGGFSVSCRAAEPKTSPLSLKNAWQSTDFSARSHRAGQWRRARELQLPAQPAAAALRVRMRPVRTPFPGRPAESVASAPLPHGRDARAVTQRGDAKKCAPSTAIAAAAGCAGPTAGAGGGGGTAGQRAGTGVGAGGTCCRRLPGALLGRVGWRPRPPRRAGAAARGEGGQRRGVWGGASGARGRLRVRPRARGRPRGGGPGPACSVPACPPRPVPSPPGGTGPAPPRPPRAPAPGPPPAPGSSSCAGPARAGGSLVFRSPALIFPDL